MVNSMGPKINPCGTFLEIPYCLTTISVNLFLSLRPSVFQVKFETYLRVLWESLSTHGPTHDLGIHNNMSHKYSSFTFVGAKFQETLICETSTPNRTDTRQRRAHEHVLMWKEFKKLTQIKHSHAEAAAFV